MNESRTAPPPLPQVMQRYRVHMNSPFTGLFARITGVNWRRLRARAHAFGDTEVSAAIDAYERGRIDSFRALKIVTTALIRLGDHRRYEAALALFDPRFPLPERRLPRRFEGHGIGGGSLDVYRILGNGESAVFEKIYQRRGSSFRNMAFAHEALLPRVEGIAYPALREIRAGKRLAAAHFAPIRYRRRRRYDVAAAARVVAALRAADVSDLEMPAHALRGRAYLIEAGLRAFPARIVAIDPARAQALAAALPRWHAIVEAFPRTVSHGDLNRPNIARDGHVIDWDEAGFHPYGYDPAYIANQSTLFRDAGALEAFFCHHFERPGAPREDWIGFLFHFLHFMQQRPRQWRNDRLFAGVLAALERELGCEPPA